ncbi:MAG: hypothetical protein R3284_00030 [Rubricoccaceae bacterium]|nr:hypothetical protein [Rubricoccaceae bacterium]
MLADLAESAIGLLLCPLVFLAPGYVVGRLTNVMDFYARDRLTRLSMALMLSVAIGPIVIFLLLHVGWWAVWLVYGAVWCYTLLLLIRERPALQGIKVPFLVCLGVGVALVLLVVDIGWGDKLYFSVAARDHVRTIALTNEVARAGFPPQNPFFNVGEPVQLFYYYGWMQLTSLVDLLGGGLVGPRGTAFAGTAFCGLALMGTVVAFVKTLPSSVENDVAQGADSTRVAVALTFLLVGGLDVVVFLAGILAVIAVGQPVVFTDIEWWNEPVLMWITSVVTAPHHVGGLIAALCGFRLTRWAVDTSDQTSGRKKWVGFVLAGIAFASSVFCSVWMGMAAAIIGAVWLIANIIRKRWNEVRGWIASGITAGVVALPYLFYLRTSGSVEGAPLRLGVRPFRPLEYFLGVAREGLEMLIHLPFLPLSYALELGFFAVAGFLYWRWRRGQGPLSQDERLIRVVLLVGILFSAFALAAVRNNDLGFRVPMFAQFVLLLWATDYWIAIRDGSINPPKQWLLPVLSLLLVVGVGSTVANALVLRFVPPAADAGIITMPGMYGDDRQLGERTKDLRDAYEWVQGQTDEADIVQHNPRPGVPRREGGYEFAYALYSERDCVAIDDDMGTMYGVLRDEYDPVAAQVARSFNLPDAAIAAEIAERFSINAYVVSDRDAVWQDSTSWVWTQEPDFISDHARVYLNPAERF